MADATAVTQQDLEAVKREAGQSVPEIKLDTGEVFKGDTWEETARAAAKAKEDTTNRLKEVENELRSLREAQQASETAKQASTTQATGFDATKYWQMVNDGHLLDAEKYKLGALFDIEPDMVVSTFNRTVEKTDKLWDSVEIEKFKMANPDYPGGEAGGILATEMKEIGGEWDSRRLSHVYAGLVKEGKIKPLEVEERNDEVIPLPSLSGGASRGAQDELSESDLIALPTAQLEALLRKKGLK